MKSEMFTTHTAAKLIGCHHTSIINWVKEGKLKAYSTPGGHRRIKRPDLVRFARKYKMSYY